MTQRPSTSIRSEPAFQFDKRTSLELGRSVMLAVPGNRTDYDDGSCAFQCPR